MRRRYEIRQRFSDGTVYPKAIEKAWTKTGAWHLLDELEAERRSLYPNSDWAYFGWDNLTGAPSDFS